MVVLVSNQGFAGVDSSGASQKVRAAMPFPFDGVFGSDFFTFAVLGMGKVATGSCRPPWPALPEVRLYN